MLFYLVCVILVAIIVYKFMKKTNVSEFFVWLTVIFVAFFHIFLNVGISMWAAEKGTWTYETSETKVSGAVIQQKQVTKSDSSAYIIWTDAEGKTHETPVDEATIIDSNEWKMVERRGDIEEFFYDILHDEETEYHFYVPMDVLYPNMAQN